MRLLRNFKFTKWKRIFVLIFMLVAALSSIIFGGLFYSGPKTVLGPQYVQSAEYVLKVKNLGASTPSAQNLAKRAAEDIKKRLDGDSNLDVQTSAEVSVDGNPNVRVSVPNIYDIGDRENIANFIEYKPNLVFTDYYGNALFDNQGKFSNDLKIGEDPQKAKIDPEKVNWEIDSKTPMKNSGASAIYNNISSIKLEWNSSSSEAEWTLVQDYVAKLPEEKRVIVAWLNLDQFIQKAKTDFKDEWDNEAKHNPYFFSFVTNKPVDKDGKKNNLKTALIKADDFMISNNVRSQGKDAQDGAILQRPTQTSSSDLSKIVRQINYGTTDYSLETQSSRFVAPSFGQSSFQFFLWASIVIFIVLTLFLVWNYGIIGLISALSLALFAFLSWTFIVLLGGVFSPIVLSALIFMTAFFVDKNIIFFEKIKSSISQGSTFEKALLLARKKMKISIFDTHVITLILGIALFYFGSLSIWGFSLAIVVSVVLSLLVLMLFTQLLVTTLLNGNILQNKRWLLIGIKSTTRSSNANKVFSSEDELIGKTINVAKKSKQAKHSLYLLALIVGLALIIMTIFMIITLSFQGGFNLNTIFGGGSIIEINGISDKITPRQFDDLVKILTSHGVRISEISKMIGDDGSIYLVRVLVNRYLDLAAIQGAISSIYQVYLANVLNNGGLELLLSGLIVTIIAITFIFIYLLLRFRWTFSLPIICNMLLDVLLVTALFIIFRLPIGLEFIISLLLILIYSANNNVLLFSEIKKRTIIHSGNLNYEQNISIVHLAIKTITKRLIFSSLIFIFLFLTLMAFTNVINITLAIGLIFGVITSAFTTIFIGTLFWNRLEMIRQKNMKKRLKNNFWDVNKPEEQTFIGINNYKI